MSLTLKQIAMRSPLGAANHISFLYVAASLKWLGNTAHSLEHDLPPVGVFNL